MITVLSNVLIGRRQLDANKAVCKLIALVMQWLSWFSRKTQYYYCSQTLAFKQSGFEPSGLQDLGVTAVEYAS